MSSLDTSNDTVIKDYQMPSLGDPQEKSAVSKFELPELGKGFVQREHLPVEKIKIERDIADKKGFSVSPVVQEYRGLRQHENDEREQRIHNEVESRLAKLKEETIRTAIDEGKEIGRLEVHAELDQKVTEQIDRLEMYVKKIMGTYSQTVKSQKVELYTLVNNLCKWVTLKELSDDGKYLSRLLEKLIIELDSRSNILIQVSKDSFEGMDDVLDLMQKRFTNLNNVRVEIDPDIVDEGIIIQSDAGIIDGTLEQQFKGLDKLFEGLLVNE